ncbi:MAG: RAD55 family ATPase [Halobacteriota archaeon]
MLLPSIGLKEIPKNAVLLVEEDLGSIKSTFVQEIAFSALKNDKKVLYISTKRSREDVLDQMSMLKMDGNCDGLVILGDFKDKVALMDLFHGNDPAAGHLYHIVDPSLNNIFDVDICIMDTFSSLFIEGDEHSMVESINSLINISRNNNTTFLLAADTGILDERVERIMRSMMDGVVQFKTQYTGGKITRYINIPKMKGMLPLNKMIAFNVTKEGIQIDTRERVG